jgi:hypothetical protein
MTTASRSASTAGSVAVVSAHVRYRRQIRDLLDDRGHGHIVTLTSPLGPDLAPVKSHTQYQRAVIAVSAQASAVRSRDETSHPRQLAAGGWPHSARVLSTSKQRETIKIE